MKDFDYIIVGAGASGLQLADAMGADPAFAEDRIALIEKQSAKGNDRTWCFWEEGTGNFDPIVYKSWDQIRFKGQGFQRKISTLPYTYKMVRASDFYRTLDERISGYPHITRINAGVQDLRETEESVRVTTTEGAYEASMVFSSVLFQALEPLMQPYPVLQQHFLGWFIRSENPIFDPEAPTFMDFDLPQKGNTRFMYLLPFSEKEGLVEYTLFSEDLLQQQEYEAALTTYITDTLGSKGYEILEREKGSIPMTCNDFSAADSERITHIGIAGGWAKASTGYTFYNTSRKIPLLVEALKTGGNLKMASRNRFWHYDRLLLDVLACENEKGSQIFGGQLRKLAPQLMFKFLNEETSIPEEIRVMASSPTLPFMKAVWRSLF